MLPTEIAREAHALAVVLAEEAAERFVVQSLRFQSGVTPPRDASDLAAWHARRERPQVEIAIALADLDRLLRVAELTRPPAA